MESRDPVLDALQEAKQHIERARVSLLQSQEGGNVLLSSVSEQLELVIRRISKKLIDKLGSLKNQNQSQDEDSKALAILKEQAHRLDQEWHKNRSLILKEFFGSVADLIATQVSRIKSEVEKERIQLNLSVPELLNLILGDQRRSEKKEDEEVKGPGESYAEVSSLGVSEGIKRRQKLNMQTHALLKRDRENKERELHALYQELADLEDLDDE